MRSGSGGGAGGGGRSAKGKSGTGTVARVVGTLGGGAAAAAAPAASAPAAAAPVAAAAAAPAQAAAKAATPTYGANVKADGTIAMSEAAFNKLAAAAPQAHQDTLMRALDSVAAKEPSGALLPIGRVRDEAARLGLADKVSFDAAATKLFNSEKIVLHYHDAPRSQSAEYRKEMVFMPDSTSRAQGYMGEFFAGIARDRGRSLEAERWRSRAAEASRG